MAYLQFTVLAIATFSLIKSGDALKCWSCSSDMDAPCADYFNTTAFRSVFRFEPRVNTPMLVDCADHGSSYPLNNKPVCMKKKQSTYGRTTYIRQCRFLHYEDKVGSCPAETTSSSTTIDFCEYCDYDGCNGATTFQQAAILTLVPVLSFLLFKQ